MKLEDNPKIDLKAYIKTARMYNVTHLNVLQQCNNSNIFI